MKNLFSFLIVAIAVFACNSENKKPNAEVKSASPSFDIQKEKAFIDSINKKFSEAIKNGDSTWVASQYSPDAEILLDGASIKGNDILAMWGGVSRSQERNWTFTTTDLQGDENFLIETGDYEIKDASNKLTSKGKYVVSWKKQPDGSWKLYRDIGSSSPIGK